MSKKWILETNEANCAEYRVPNPGEHYLGMRGLTAYKAPESPIMTAQCVILHPVADDCVMVPRVVIELLHMPSVIAYCGRQDCSDNLARMTANVRAAMSAVRDCAKRAEKEDAISVALANAKYAIQISGLTATVKFECLSEIDKAIIAREAELKARKS